MWRPVTTLKNGAIPKSHTNRTKVKMNTMKTVIISHEVNNFSDWKTGFDVHEKVRASFGIKVESVNQSDANPNHVTVICNFPNMEAVNGFINSPDLHEAMEKGGVIGKPDVKILNRV